MSVNQFKAPQNKWQVTYTKRVARLKLLIDCGAPPIIIGSEAQLVVKCFRYNLRDRWHDWYIWRCPLWIMWLTSAQYRRDVREMDKAEAEVDEGRK